MRQQHIQDEEHLETAFPHLFSLSISLAVDHLFLKVGRKKKNLLSACAYGLPLLSASLSCSFSHFHALFISRSLAGYLRLSI